MNKVGFPPIVGERPHVLILGSMPGEASLRQAQYYAHPRNAFWYIMGALFQFDAEAGYTERTAALKKNRVALWDVLQECEREGSLDTAIVDHSIRTNDLPRLLESHPTLRLIVFNGAMAERVFRRRVLPDLSRPQQRIRRIRLPSTSPAMATLSREQKLQAWSVIPRALEL